MSNALAIAAVTTTLRTLLSQAIRDEVGTGGVTTKPPDKARDSNDGNQINLFLYQTHPNTGFPQGNVLAVNLYYLITVYGANDDDVLAHRLLGLAMQTLNDYTVLRPADIQAALAESDLQNQVERVKFTPLSLNLEEISKLWTTFQTQYRISVAYEASVVLIDSRRPKKSPLPVLSIGDRLPDGRDEGIKAQANVICPKPPFPNLEALSFPIEQQPSAQLGEVLTLTGHLLQGQSPGTNVDILFKHPRLSEPIILSPDAASSPDQLLVTLDASNPSWLAGAYGVSVRFSVDGQEFTTNSLSFTLAPMLTLPTQPLPELTVTCNPPVWLWQHADRPQQLRGQQISLFLGSRELKPIADNLPELDREPTDPDPQPDQKVSSLTFDIRDMPMGDYFVRLRVDGVDSLVIDWTATPLVFNSQYQVTIQ